MEKQRYFLYKCPHHVANLNNMRLNNKWCDVTIIAKDSILRAHKVVLAANLKYFETQLSISSFEDVITMSSVEGADLEIFLCYAYTGEILITDHNALGLLELANYLKEDDIKKSCIEFLENHLKADDSVRAYKVANVVECLTLKNVARKTVLSNFENCSKTKEYFDLVFRSLIDILVGVKFNYSKSQEIFFEGIMRWIMHDAKHRQSYTNDLLTLLDTTKLKDDYLAQYLGSVASRNHDNGIVKDAVVSHVTGSESKRKESQADFPAKELMILGDVCFEPHFQFYSFAEEKWSPLQQIPDANRTYSNSAVLNDKLYYINRSFGKSHLQMYNLKTKRSTDLSSSSSILSWSSICACKSFIYLCGGKSVVEFNQVLRYDPLRNSFKTLPSMKTKRSHAVAIVHEDCLYVVGGRNGSHGVTSVEKYDPEKKIWTKLASMREGRYGHAVAVLDGKLYVCGGVTSGTNINSVEVYDPSKNSWRRVSSMKKARYHFFATTHEDKLLAVGGDEEKTVEVYDPIEDQWQIDDSQMSPGLEIRNPRGGFQIY